MATSIYDISYLGFCLHTDNDTNTQLFIYYTVPSNLL